MTTPCLDFDFMNDWFPVAVVLAAFFLSLAATTVSGMSKRHSGETLFTRSVGKSRYEPPGWVFGVIWLIIFVGYTAIWVHVNRNIGVEKDRNRANWLLGVGIVLNALWSFFIIFGSIGSIGPITAHYLATATLFVLGLYNIYLINEFDRIFRTQMALSDTNRYIYIGVLVIYTAWAFIAFLLSVSSPVHHHHGKNIVPSSYTAPVATALPTTESKFVPKKGPVKTTSSKK